MSNRRMSDKKLDELGLLDEDEPTESATLAARKGTVTSFSFFVPGIAKPQGSKRAYVNKHTGKASLVESAGQPLADWRGDVKRFAVDCVDDTPPLKGPVEVSLGFYLPRPKSHPKTRETWPVARPDVDKLARAILDALTSVCFHDDSQIVHLTAYKEWASEGTPAGCRVNVWGVGK